MALLAVILQVGFRSFRVWGPRIEYPVLCRSPPFGRTSVLEVKDFSGLGPDPLQGLLVDKSYLEEHGT